MEEKSKTAFKREAEAVQKLGERLVALSRDQVKGMAIPEELKQAVLFAQGISRHGARRRQLQFIGSLMRTLDPEPVKKALEGLALGRTLAENRVKKVKQWQKDLMEKGEDLVEPFLEQFPGTDRQRMRTLLRNAKKKQGKKGFQKSEKALFEYLQKILENRR